MDSSNEFTSENGQSNGRFEGYSHYKTISSSIAETIDEALSAYSDLDSLHAEGAKVTAQQAARARSKIKLAALKLVPELREDAHHNNQYQEILARWHGPITIPADSDDQETRTVQPDFPHTTPEDGYFDALSAIQLQSECPAWLEDWVIDIRTAGWEIGYLQAGRSISPEPDLPDANQEFETMFADY